MKTSSTKNFNIFLQHTKTTIKNTTMKISPIQPFDKVITVPKDKSITHRAFILAAKGKGTTTIYSPLLCEDTLATINALQTLGISIQSTNQVYKVQGTPQLSNFRSTQSTLFTNSQDNATHPNNSIPQPPPSLITINAQNSATTARLLLGLLASTKDCQVQIIGDHSLSSRPMQRVITPLSQMGADITSHNGKLPVSIRGKSLQSIAYDLPLASAQIKSAILLAGLSANGTTTITGKIESRNHTEILLQSMQAKIKVDQSNHCIQISPSELYPINIQIPGDTSSAAYFLVLASILPHSQITIQQVGINPTRTGIFQVLDKCGVDYLLQNIVSDTEPIADITARYSSNLQPFEIDTPLIPYLIDEIPILCVLACFCCGQSVIQNASELRYKESDRITTIVTALKTMGADITESADTILINGTGSLLGGGVVQTNNDHRIAMSLTIAALASQQTTIINNTQCINTSYPTFFDQIRELTQ